MGRAIWDRRLTASPSPYHMFSTSATKKSHEIRIGARDLKQELYVSKTESKLLTFWEMLKTTPHPIGLKWQCSLALGPFFFFF